MIRNDGLGAMVMSALRYTHAALGYTFDYTFAAVFSRFGRVYCGWQRA